MASSYYWHGAYRPCCRGPGRGTPPGPPPRWRITSFPIGSWAPHELGRGRAPGPPPPTREEYRMLRNVTKEDNGIAPLGKKLYLKTIKDKKNTIFGQVRLP